jgi:hypothetical protein
MATETRSYTGDHPDWNDPFPEPRTFPGGWDLAELPGYEPSPNSGKAFAVAAALLDAAWIEHRPDPFPEPKDFPCGWDLSGVLARDRERMLAQNSEQEPPSFLLPISFDAAAYATT